MAEEETTTPSTTPVDAAEPSSTGGGGDDAPAPEEESTAHFEPVVSLFLAFCLFLFSLSLFLLRPPSSPFFLVPVVLLYRACWPIPCDESPYLPLPCLVDLTFRRFSFVRSNLRRLFFFSSNQ